jgi:hypothetical protein
MTQISNHGYSGYDQVPLPYDRYEDEVLIPQEPLPKRGVKTVKSKRKNSHGDLSQPEKAKRYDQYVINDKAPNNRDAQIGDFLDRMTFEPENLFPTNSAGLARFVPTGFKSARVRGTRFDEPPIPFKAPSVQAAVNASEFFIKYNRDNPVGGPYKDKRLYNDPLHRAATQPQRRSYAERLASGYDNLTFDEQQVFRPAGGRWFVDNFIRPGTTTTEQREENIDEFIRLLNERGTVPNTSDLSPLYDSEAPFEDGLAAAPDVSDDDWERNTAEWLQNNLESKALRQATATTQNIDSLGTSKA